MTTILQARSRRFVNTPAIERVATRTLRYLHSGFSVHLRGPAGTGKTTLALHLADLLGRPIMLVFGDDEFKTSDLIGNQTGYTRKKVVDNFIHSVVKVEDELKQNWVDSRLTLACREGFTLVYDEFNRSRPEVNNVLLSALEEKLLVLPPSGNRSEYIRVHPQFRVIFTSNPEEYCGVHNTQDALLDRIVTINIPEPDELTQQEILVQKVGVEREEALFVTRLVKAFRLKTGAEKSSGLRSCLMIAKVCQEHEISVAANNLDFRDVCSDVLLARTKLPLSEVTTLLWRLLDEFGNNEVFTPEVIELPATQNIEPLTNGHATVTEVTTIATAEADYIKPLTNGHAAATEVTTIATAEANAELAVLAQSISPDASVISSEPADTFAVVETEVEQPEPAPEVTISFEKMVHDYLLEFGDARVSEIEAALAINRIQTVDAVRALTEQGILKQRGDRVYIVK